MYENYTWSCVILILLIQIIYRFLAITVMFNQSVYSVDEDTGVTQPVLVLSNPASTDITVEAYNTDGSATGE